jgi:hypothetical protein
MCGLRCIDLVSPERAAVIVRAVNARRVTRRKDRKLVEIQLTEHGNDFALPARRGNPAQNVHDRETETNPPRVWAFKTPRKAA